METVHSSIDLNASKFSNKKSSASQFTVKKICSSHLKPKLMKLQDTPWNMVYVSGNTVYKYILKNSKNQNLNKCVNKV